MLDEGEQLFFAVLGLRLAVVLGLRCVTRGSVGGVGP